jgi:hypothetical protein
MFLYKNSVNGKILYVFIDIMNRLLQDMGLRGKITADSSACQTACTEDGDMSVLTAVRHAWTRTSEQIVCHLCKQVKKHQSDLYITYKFVVWIFVLSMSNASLNLLAPRFMEFIQTARSVKHRLKTGGDSTVTGWGLSRLASTLRPFAPPTKHYRQCWGQNAARAERGQNARCFALSTRRTSHSVPSSACCTVNQSCTELTPLGPPTRIVICGEYHVNVIIYNFYWRVGLVSIALCCYVQAWMNRRVLLMRGWPRSRAQFSPCCCKAVSANSHVFELCRLYSLFRSGLHNDADHSNAQFLKFSFSMPLLSTLQVTMKFNYH